MAIERLGKTLQTKWDAGEGRGFRARDDEYRYARPEYIRRLGGQRKRRRSYSHSGFDQLVNISSGVPRYFLEAAAKMYDREIAAHAREKLFEIGPSTQDRIVREQAEERFMVELEKLKVSKTERDQKMHEAVGLHNVLLCLCSWFELRLLEETTSERRYFSFAISNYVDRRLEPVFRFGVRLGYMSRTTIGRKERFGRTDLYVLARRLAPLCNLDPNGCWAYKCVTSQRLLEMMFDPDAFRKRLRRARAAAGELETGQGQLSLDGV